MPFMDISFGEGLLADLGILPGGRRALALIPVIGDLFRDHEFSGIAKAVWVFFLIFLPFLGVLLYLIVRGNGMRDRTLKTPGRREKALRQLRPRAGARRLPADELHKLAELKDKERSRPRSSTRPRPNCSPRRETRKGRRMEIFEVEQEETLSRKEIATRLRRLANMLSSDDEEISFERGGMRFPVHVPEPRCT